MDRCQRCGRMYPTSVHMDCGQDLCDPCLERHEDRQCSRPNYPPTRDTQFAMTLQGAFPDHTTPEQCLANLEQLETNGGRWEYLDQEARFRHSGPEMPTGDCSVVALVHATFRPSTGQSYQDAQFELSTSTRPWMYKLRRLGEGNIPWFVRRIKQYFSPPNRNPIHGTPSHAMGEKLWISGYKHIYPNAGKRWWCICDMGSTYVVDMLMPEGHSITVHQRTAYTTAFLDPESTIVANVYRLDPDRTRGFKNLREEQRRRKQEEEDWWRQRNAELGYPDIVHLNSDGERGKSPA